LQLTSLHTLHFFPTRRSSDLGIQAVFLKNLQGFLQTDVGGDGHNLFPGRQTIADEHDSSSLVAINRLSGRYSILPARKKILPPRDRKSTRLNSSHVKISYAVF